MTKSGGASEPAVDRLAHFDVARDHCSINRRNDIGIAEVGFGGMKRRLELGDLGLVARLSASAPSQKPCATCQSLSGKWDASPAAS